MAVLFLLPTENANTDIDRENNGGILTLTFTNMYQITPSHQAWVAARSADLHSDFDQQNNSFELVV